MRIKKNTGFMPFLILAAGLINYSSLDSKEGEAVAVDNAQFNDYWYAGKAELTRYDLEQARYGEIRRGDAVLIFVTEDFLTDKQVKYEFGDKENATSVLKLNFVRKFTTGIYPYSMMSSIFTPVDVKNQSTLKITSSSQEWCGHTFMQLNRREGEYRIQLRSYFQKEGDQNFTLKPALLEDEIWTKIRLAPNSLPTGEIKIVPGFQYARLRHVPLKIEKATASLTTSRDEDLSNQDLQIYTIDYKDLRRKLVIQFENQFPYKIIAWEESYPSGFGPDAKMMTTRAVRTHSLMTDYWTKNKTSDAHLREELGLSSQ